MKEIILTPIKPVQQICVNDLPGNPIIGFTTCDIPCQSKGWLQMTSYDSGRYALYGIVDGVNMGDGWGSQASLKDAFKFLISCKFTPYYFETQKELLKWLAED
jgi:hypothetical protein